MTASAPPPNPGRAQALLDLGRASEAIPLIRQAIAADPHDARSHCRLSAALLRLGDLPGAQAAAQDAIANDPEVEWAHRLLSAALQGQGHKREAVAAAQESRRLAPAAAEPLIRLVEAARAIPDRALAQQACTELVALAPERAISHRLAAVLHLDARRNVAAAASFREALRLDPTSHLAHNGLGVALLRSGDRAGALRAFQAAAELEPGDPTAAENIRRMARRDRLPLSRWALHPLLYVPALVVGMRRLLTHRRDYATLPEAARRDVLRWSWRDVLALALALATGVAGTIFVVTYTAASGSTHTVAGIAMVAGLLGLAVLRRRS